MLNALAVAVRAWSFVLNRQHTHHGVSTTTQLCDEGGWQLTGRAKKIRTEQRSQYNQGQYISCMYRSYMRDKNNKLGLKKLTSNMSYILLRTSFTKDSFGRSGTAVGEPELE